MTLILRLAVIALSLVTCDACATTRPRAEVTPAPTGSVSVAMPGTDLGGVLSLIGEKNMAQACPVSADRALTNGHVAKEEPVLGGEPVPLPYIWESMGQVGLLGSRETTAWDRFRDLAYVQAYHSTFPRWYPIAKEAPKPGDRVRFIGWDFRKRKDAYGPREFAATVIRVRNAHVIFTPPGVPGTSGSCVLNDRGEVVAINAFGKDLDDTNTVGGAIGVWGNLLELGQ